MKAVRVQFDKYSTPNSLTATLTNHEPAIKQLHSKKRITSKQKDLLFPATGEDPYFLIKLIKISDGIKLVPSRHKGSYVVQYLKTV